MFPQYASSGIVIANIDDILYSMASLIGESACDKAPSSELQLCPSPSRESKRLHSEIFIRSMFSSN